MTIVQCKFTHKQYIEQQNDKTLYRTEHTCDADGWAMIHLHSELLGELSEVESLVVLV